MPISLEFDKISHLLQMTKEQFNETFYHSAFATYKKQMTKDKLD
jgi:hypothetical protein